MLIQNEREKSNFGSTSSYICEVGMLDRLTLKAACSWLNYKWSKAKTYAMEALCKNDKHFHNRLKVLENTTPVFAKVTFNDLQALKTR